jgi:hypothetical protein
VNRGDRYYAAANRRALKLVERQVLKPRFRFFEKLAPGKPIPDVKYPYCRWERTLKQLAIRYRKPYTARHRERLLNIGPAVHTTRHDPTNKVRIAGVRRFISLLRDHFY